MNKFLLLAMVAFTFATTVPAIADDTMVTTETSVETTVDTDVACHDADGTEVDCNGDTAVHDGDHHDDIDHDEHMDVEANVSVEVE